MKECCKCGCDITEEPLYEYDDNIYCYYHLMEKFDYDSICTKVEFYIDEEGNDLGNDEYPDELLERLHRIVDFEELRGDSNEIH